MSRRIDPGTAVARKRFRHDERGSAPKERRTDGTEIRIPRPDPRQPDRFWYQRARVGWRPLAERSHPGSFELFTRKVLYSLGRERRRISRHARSIVLHFKRRKGPKRPEPATPRLRLGGGRRRNGS